MMDLKKLKPQNKEILSASSAAKTSKRELLTERGWVMLTKNEKILLKQAMASEGIEKMSPFIRRILKKAGII